MNSDRDRPLRLGLIGAGNMAGALARGIVNKGVVAADRIWVCDKIRDKAQALASELGVTPVADAADVLAKATTVILAVKPQDLPSMLDAIGSAVTADHLVVSIAAGMPIVRIAAHLPPETRLVRVMPNTPALVGQGAAGVAAGPSARPQDLAVALDIFGAVGLALAVEEKDLDAVTALSGSGPAYVFRFIEILIEAGSSMGLAPEVSRRLALQTVLGSARLAAESSEEPAELRRRVTSPGGTTAAALAVFEEKGLAETLKTGILRARDRSIELARG